MPFRTGRNVELPIQGEKVTELRFGRSPVTIVFGDRYEKVLQIEEAITLSQGRCEQVLTGSRHGAEYNLKELGPLLEVFGEVVVEATALRDGTIRLRFHNELELSVVSTTGYEAWHFHSPEFSLHGTYGHLI